MPLNIDITQKALAIPAILRLAFRPLFLAGTLFSIIAIAWWTNYWVNLDLINASGWVPYGGPIWWHGHEMLFGFGIAIVAGFLLTAVKTWTGVPGLSGMLLGFLVFDWILSRFLIAFGGEVNPLIIATVDVSFLVFTAIAMAYSVLKVRQWRNLMFVPILLLLAILNAVSHWSIQTNDYLLATKTLHATIILFVLIISILGGRVIPFFTANATSTVRQPAILLLDAVTILSVLSMLVIALIGFQQVEMKVLLSISCLAAITSGWRLLRWGIQHTLKTPLLWSLHFSFLFIPIGFLLLALFTLGYISSVSIALHSFTVGAIAGMILAMISRVTLGHTGRPLREPKIMKIAFSLILFSALIRIVLPEWFPSFYNQSIVIAGIFWIAAFGLYFYYYAPMLVTTRADGRAG